MTRNKAATMFVLAAAALAAPAQAASLPRSGVFVYRNFCIEKESADTAGIGLIVIRSSVGDEALYYYSEGAIELPLLADELTINAAGHLKAHFASVEKDVPTDARLEADLSTEAAIVTVNNDRSVEPGTKLPRVTNLGSRIPACKPR